MALKRLNAEVSEDVLNEFYRLAEHRESKRGPLVEAALIAYLKAAKDTADDGTPIEWKTEFKARPEPGRPWPKKKAPKKRK
jgi:hypothetical protein